MLYIDGGIVKDCSPLDTDEGHKTAHHFPKLCYVIVIVLFTTAGNDTVDQILSMTLGNIMLVAGSVAFTMDNLLPGE